MTKPRIIKKYPNRRLYDTDVSRYITLADLQKLVLERISFEVRDANSNKDITRNILLQIIAEQESGGKPLFTTDILMRFIRLYGESMQDALSTYLEHSLSLFDEQRKTYQAQLQSAMKLPGNPMSAITELTQHNMKVWQDLQDQFFEAAGVVQKRPKKDTDTEK